LEISFNHYFLEKKIHSYNLSHKTFLKVDNVRFEGLVAVRAIGILKLITVQSAISRNIYRCQFFLLKTEAFTSIGDFYPTAFHWKFNDHTPPL